jgi:general secretion pathway protein F
VLQFTQQLATLLGAGQPLDRALQILLELPRARKRAHHRAHPRSPRGGGALSDALESEPGVFSKLYVNMVRAGEVGGSLDVTLARLTNYLERAKALRESVINALIYPAILVVMVFGALFVLLAPVVPRFLPMFKDMNVELPMITKGRAVRRHRAAGLVVADGDAAVAGVVFMRRRPDIPRSTPCLGYAC